MPRAKETLSRVASPRVSSKKISNFVQSNLDFSTEHGRSCDICRHSETILNPISVCSSCKVGTHLDCYHNVTNSAVGVRLCTWLDHSLLSHHHGLSMK